MLNSKRILGMVRKWQKVAAMGRQRIVSKPTNSNPHSDECSPSVASRGHIFVYSTDGKRFMIPLRYLTSNLFRVLFKMSEEAFGLPSDGPVTLPCDASCMECIISMLRHGASIEVERAVLASIASAWSSVSSLPPIRHDELQPIIYGF